MTTADIATQETSQPHLHLIVTRNLPTGAERTEFYRRVRRGQFIAVIRGVYMPKEVWNSLDRHAKYRAITQSVGQLHDEPVFSHHSAAALWRLPWVGPWPQRAHVLVEERSGGNSTRSTVRHAVGIPSTNDEIDGCLVTTLERTIVDIASVANFGQAVTVADAALRRATHPINDAPRSTITRNDLLAELDRVSPTHGHTKARAAIEFSNGLADRPGESMSRVSMFRAKLPVPELQVPMMGASGRTWVVDFWWPRANLIGEFDGEWKYTDPEFMAGRTRHQVLLDEKFREDDLRAAGHSFSRWGWKVAISPAQLRAHLRSAGLV